MTPEQFLLTAGPLPEPMLLVSGDGLILAANRATEGRLGVGPQELRGKMLADVVADPPGEVAHYLRLCCRSRSLVPGAVVLRRDGGGIACRAEGAVVQPRAEGSEAVLMLRLLPKESAVGQFVALNRQIEELGREVQRRRRAEEEARRQEERLRVTLLSIGDAVIVTDPEGRVVTMNPVAESLTGWEHGEAARQLLTSVFRVVNEDSRQPVEHPALRALREGVVVGLANHSVLIARDGTERPIDDSAAPIRDGQGHVIGVVLVFRDVTARRAAEGANERLAATLESLTDGFLRLDRDWRIVYMNPEFERQWQRPREPQFGKVFWEEWPATLGTPLESEYRRAMAGRMTVQFENHYAPFDRWFSLKADPTPDGGLAVFCRDVTDRKRAEAAARANEARFRTLADSIPQLAWTARPDGHIFWYNRRWYEYTGTTPEQMEGWGWQSVHDPEVLPQVLERWKGSIATGEPFDMVFPLKGADGRFRPFLTRVVPFRDDGGRVVQWFGTNTDVSEIEQMRARLEEADRRKDQFVMMLAHELRNPLAPIRNGLQLLQASGADRQIVEQARGMMARQVGHMARIIEDLLDVSRLLRGRLDLRPERLDLGRLTRTVVEDQRPAFDRAGVALEADLPEVPAWVSADPTRLTQVLDNLLQNAVKFTDRGGTVTVRVRADPSRREAVLAVRDTGVGIGPDLLPRLFETFTQADRSLERSKGGLGLGLSLVKGLVELHGGEVQARSDGPGRGAEFAVALPLQPEPAAVTEMPKAPKHAPQRLRVLVVEDNRDAADSLKMLLQLFGYEVTVAYCGRSGVEAAKSWGPDVVLCDIGLPGLSGYEVARELRQHPATAGARMIAVTGYGGDEDRLKTREAGFDAHLTKPADPAQLQELLSRSGALN